MLDFRVVSKCSLTKARRSYLRFTAKSFDRIRHKPHRHANQATSSTSNTTNSTTTLEKKDFYRNHTTNSNDITHNHENETDHNAIDSQNLKNKINTNDDNINDDHHDTSWSQSQVWGEAVDLPCYMPVATAATIKTLTPLQVQQCGYKLILANTYHLAEKLGLEILKLYDSQKGGIKNIMNWPYYLLTDSGGYQLVSLSKLLTINDDGVNFVSPFSSCHTNSVKNDSQDDKKEQKTFFLSPEKSMEIQVLINSDIIMQLDDVVPSTCEDIERIKESVVRSSKWLKRASDFLQAENYQRLLDGSNSSGIAGHLFPIVQGGLDKELRNESLKRILEENSPKDGYAIGGLSGGESKSTFCDVVYWCTQKLPQNKPRYVMGVGYFIDQLLAVALGADMFDCVFPTRTARFGNALTLEENINLNKMSCATDFRLICDYCKCLTCSSGYSRAFLHYSLSETATKSLITIHNLHYHHNSFIRKMHKAIDDDKFMEFAADCIIRQFGCKENIPDYVYHCFDDILKVNLDQFIHKIIDKKENSL